jgi:hypothetical protein
MMKRLALVCCVLLLAPTPVLAKPDAAPHVKTPPSPQRQADGGLRYFNGNDCVNQSGRCLPDVVVTPHYEQHRLALQNFEEAVNSGSTGAYFTSDRWTYLLPALKNHPKLLEILRSGIPVVRLDRPNGKRFYVATRLSRDELLRRIAARSKNRILEGVEVCIPVKVK